MPIRSDPLGLAEAPPRSAEVARALRCRLGAVRASLESALRDLPDSDPLAQTVRCSLREVERLGRDLRELLDWSLPSEPRVGVCSVEELGLAIVQALPAEDRARVRVVEASGACRVETDPERLARCVAYLVQAGLREFRAARLEAGEQNGAVRFEIEFEGALDGREDARDQESLGLATAIARRELERLSVALRASTDGSRLHVELPCASAGGSR